MADRRGVLFVAAFAPPWGGVGALRITKLLKYLPREWRATLLTSDASNPENSDDSLRAEIPSDVAIIRVASPLGLTGDLAGTATRAWRAGRLRRIIGVGKGIASAFLLPDRWIAWSLRIGRIDSNAIGPVQVVVSTGPPHSDHLAAARIARRLGVPFVMDMRDDWYQNPMTSSRAPWNDPIQRRLEGWCVSRAAHVVVIADEAVAKLTARYPRLRGRVTSIPNGFDPADIPTEGGAPSDRAGELDFAFLGTLRREQQVGRFFEAFNTFARERPTAARLRFRGVIDRDIEREATRAGGKRWMEVLPPVEHRSAVEEMARADVLVVFTGNGGGGTATMTGKLFEYLAVRRPVLLVGPDGPAAALVREARAGVVADPDDEKGIRAALDMVAAMAADPGFSGTPPTVLARYDRRSQAETWSVLLAEVTAGREG